MKSGLLYVKTFFNCRTEYDTVTEQKCETKYETEYETQYETKCETKYDTKCEVQVIFHI